MADNITNNEDFISSNGKAPSIDELQQLILQKMEEDKVESEAETFEETESTEEFSEETTEEFGASLENEYYDISPVEKKYVVSISSDVVPYFEKIDPEDRSQLVNSLLFEHFLQQNR